MRGEGELFLVTYPRHFPTKKNKRKDPHQEWEKGPFWTWAKPILPHSGNRGSLPLSIHIQTQKTFFFRRRRRRMRGIRESDRIMPHTYVPIYNYVNAHTAGSLMSRQKNNAFSGCTLSCTFSGGKCALCFPPKSCKSAHLETREFPALSSIP